MLQCLDNIYNQQKNYDKQKSFLFKNETCMYMCDVWWAEYPEYPIVWVCVFVVIVWTLLAQLYCDYRAGNMLPECSPSKKIRINIMTITV